MSTPFFTRIRLLFWAFQSVFFGCAGQLSIIGKAGMGQELTRGSQVQFKRCAMHTLPYYFHPVDIVTDGDLASQTQAWLRGVGQNL